MSGETPRVKKFLFVDDDAQWLGAMQELFGEMSRGAWQIATAENHAQALAHLSKESVDAVVLDVSMPVMDGVQFLRLLRRAHPGIQVAMLTGNLSEETKKTCLGLGAALFLEKLPSPRGFEAVFAALDALADAVPQTGFHGMMRRVGLQDVLQMECLGRKSSVLEVFTEKTRGRIFIADGSIVHAETGALQGEGALYGLLALRGGEFNLLPFSEPSVRSISGHYEFLLMEAARLVDESSPGGDLAPSAAPAQESWSDPPVPVSDAEPIADVQVRIEEVLLCSGSGEVLHEWQVRGLENRMEMLSQIEQQISDLANLVPVGGFDRLEILMPNGRAVCQVHPHLRSFVRSATMTPPII